MSDQVVSEIGTKLNYKEDLDRIWAKIDTNMGSMKVELYAKECPETVWNFVNLAEGRQKTVKGGNFYDGIIIHRVIEGFVIQAGCPEGVGTGGPGYQFADEFNDSLKHDQPGILSMANAGPGTNGSQFFITLAPTPHLDGRHTVFGSLVEGAEVLQKIGSAPTAALDKPVQDIVIENISIER